MNVSRLSAVILVAGSVVLSSAALADRGSGSDRRDDRRQDSNSSCSSGSGKSSSSASNAKRQRIRLIGRVGSDNNGGVKTTVKYETRGDTATTANRRFDVEVQGLTPGTTLNVVIAGKTVATVTASSLGVAKLELRPSPDDANEQPIPGSFPRLKAGDVVTVGSVNVTLRTR